MTTRDGVDRLRRTVLDALVLALLATSGCSGSDEAQEPGIIRVRVALFGGPATLHGGMALNNAPQPGVEVTVRNLDGATWSGTTGADGWATLSVPADTYDVHSDFCGRGRERVAVLSGQTTPVRIRCDVP